MSSQRDNLTKEYVSDEIVVEWEPRLCYHSQNCVRSLPQVFDDSRRPWIKVDAAGADEVEAAVARCPSGALRTRRLRRSTNSCSRYGRPLTDRCSSPAVSGSSTLKAPCSSRASGRRSVAVG